MPLVKRLKSFLYSEWRHLFYFGLIGASSVLLVVGGYALISRVLWTTGPRTLQYILVVCIVTWLNYEANRHFTFQITHRSIGSLGRFATVATILNGILFWLGHEILGILDFTVIIINAGLVACFTFSSHRLFTFHAQPWRLVERVRKMTGYARDES